jgi:hypothetical protein
VALLLAIGCGEPAAKPVPVEGTITFEGQPVADGEVYFKTAGLVPEVLPVRDGRFEGAVMPGTRRVEVYAYQVHAPPVKPADQAPAGAGDETAPGRVNVMPAKFNEGSTLTAEVTASGPNTFTFHLTTR